MIDLKKVYWFHGHCCPMSTIGFRAGHLAEKLLKIKGRDQHKNVRVNVYYRSCALDGLQIAFPATFGNGNLQVVNKNKMVYEFIDDKKQIMIRIMFTKELTSIIQAYIQKRSTSNDAAGESAKKEISKAYKKLLVFTQKASDKALFEYSVKSI